jgi:nucleotide-binding universal stress UspA family protein
MNYKTLLVHLDDSRQSGLRTRIALDLARRFDAHLIGLYIVCQDLMRPMFRPGEGLRPAVLEAQHEARRERAEAAFLEAARLAMCKAEWRAPPGPAVETAALHARHADLVVLGQNNPHDPAAYIARHFVTDLLMTAGRPALVLPYTGGIDTLGQNVLVAWDGSREAARAVADALPLLRRAASVTIEAVTPPGYRTPEEAAPAAIEVAAWLDPHGIRASFSATPRVAGVSTGATLLNRASDLHADLLVMGAYGHSRGWERALGGATRTLLESMTVPVLISH